MTINILQKAVQVNQVKKDKDFKSIILLEAAVFRAARNFLEGQGYIEMFPPRIVRASGACENIDTLFEVTAEGEKKWFRSEAGKPVNAYLAQTGQLYLEAFVSELKKVYCVGPSFRAERAIDNRHLTEFKMIEIEFEGDFEKLLEIIQATVYQIAQYVAQQAHLYPQSYSLSEKDIERLQEVPVNFARLTYDQAITTLQALGEKVNWGDDISSYREQLLIQSTGNIPLFITHFPDPMWPHGKELEVEKFFNMLPDEKNPGRVLSADLILPGAGESVGAAARIHNVDVMIDRLKKSKMYKRLVSRGGDLDDFSWYINQLRTRGSVPHAGCGFGMARIIKWIVGKDNIHDCLSFPQHREYLI
ncbi:MAG: hypothetical protein A3F94_01045 [Candidatus Spechtbacteria bacterium RIFCSPLOWO2_12_FULL_38_22]|uniref:Aminoacyl-transfer RNA synthetases class-II family profile domain-containing protein n=1 Tax=Candidatus Spechtbacteria bacterium RIFCSPLOWO2_12_FULL_38_22 TaxID=1802165 RepID=A0A1G2HI79_9BACT|nr:MAG: hypothetical protein A2728_01585 [Candidatus Spechtbacteria bacterium RIFCSPHIGHO2_01_FULL_38_11]OGZ59853.1 MAG: hypothetical protein A3E58_02085 [Candidatus Spechtbacteria bacterium RIFCSPHIGHO2_12_FULL_38_30]OGZ60750.1 MAG: hypothetical protein A3A00_02470 [Candidatus Spechtbacteria bacterium RIFCSPLOWO2_01_FULL_38_20]OGZ62153.1 MAG: hypothetical protein A3F94_01045 [Candidatus Spechtbacteria bacterium RIFCSPLOWO2_12_FULL_38_22]